MLSNSGLKPGHGASEIAVHSQIIQTNGADISSTGVQTKRKAGH